MLTRRDFSKSVIAGGAALLSSGDPSVVNLAAGEPPAPQDEAPRKTNMKYDLVIKGGTVVDPGQGLHAPLDVGVKNGKILNVARDIPESEAAKTFSAKDRIVTPGFIDLHTHWWDQGLAPLTAAAAADHYCLGRGVTTVVDAGTTGYLSISRFVKDIVNPAVTRIYPLVHLSPVGPVSGLQNPMENLNWVDPQLTAQAASNNKPAVVGIKVHLSQRMSSRPKDMEKEFLKRALEAAELSRLPLMVHLNETYYPLRDNLDKMRKGDVFTHCFNEFPTTNPIDSDGKIRPEVREARARGVIFDTGDSLNHAHFRFAVAEACLRQGFLPDTISSDMSKEHAGEFDLITIVSKWMSIGLELDKAIAMVTINPTKVFNFGVQIGTLRPGSEGDISISELQEGSFDFFDGAKVKRVGRQRLLSTATVCRGELFVNRL
jgi:dihydroorotase